MGFGPFAVANNIIVVYPQANTHWDNEGYTGVQYDTQNGVQP